MIQPIQIILFLFLSFAISRVYLRAKEGTLKIGEILFWGGLFTLATVGIFDPRFTTFAAKQLGIGRGVDVVLYLSIILLFYLIFRTNVMMENLHHEITKLVQEIALLKAKSKKK
jgi:hypothetical protein